jgi:hypothetical protein
MYSCSGGWNRTVGRDDPEQTPPDGLENGIEFVPSRFDSNPVTGLDSVGDFLTVTHRIRPMNRRRFLRRATGAGTCVALAGCAGSGGTDPEIAGPEDLLVTDLGVRTDGPNVGLSIGVYVDRTEPSKVTVEGEIAVDENRASKARTVRLSGERKRLSLQLLFTDVAKFPHVVENVWARVRVGLDGELSEWHERTI